MDVFEGAIEAGNSDLDPLESMNFDVALEWYLQPAGLLSAGVFYKDIDNPIFNRIQIAGRRGIRGPLLLGARGPAVPERRLRRDRRRRARLPAAVHRPAGHSSRPGRLAQLHLDRQRGGGGCSRTRKVPFFLQSEHIGNVALFYELSGLELRLAYAYRSDYLDTIGDTAEPGPVLRHARPARLQGELPVHEAGLGVLPVAEHQRRAAALLQRRPLAARRERDLLLERARRHELQVLRQSG